MGSHDDEDDAKPESVAEAVTEMKIENEDSPSDGSAPETPRDEVVVNGSVTPSKPTDVFTTATKDTTTTNSSANTTPPNGASPTVKSRSQSHSSIKDDDEDEEEEEEQKMGGGITVKIEPGQPPKLARTSSQKVVTRPPPLFNDLPDDTVAAKATFQLMESCTYANKYMGYTEHAMECDCAEEWGKLIFNSFFLPRRQHASIYDGFCVQHHLLSGLFNCLVFYLTFTLFPYLTKNVFF